MKPQRGDTKNMAGTYTFLGTHFVFSTKNRVACIDDNIKERLFPYIGGIIKELGGVLISINAMPDHIHIYAYMPKTCSVSKFMEVVKGNSSKWIHKTFPEKRDFSWQEGYGAFAVCKSLEKTVVQYILDQENHHRKKSFKEEFIEILKKHGVDYEEKYIWE